MIQLRAVFQHHLDYAVGEGHGRAQMPFDQRGAGALPDEYQHTRMDTARGGTVTLSNNQFDGQRCIRAGGHPNHQTVFQQRGVERHERLLRRCR